MIASWSMKLWFVTDEFKQAINSKKHNLYRSVCIHRQFYLRGTVQVVQYKTLNSNKMLSQIFCWSNNTSWLARSSFSIEHPDSSSYI